MAIASYPLAFALTLRAVTKAIGSFACTVLRLGQVL